MRTSAGDKCEFLVLEVEAEVLLHQPLLVELEDLWELPSLLYAILNDTIDHDGSHETLGEDRVPA